MATSLMVGSSIMPINAEQTPNSGRFKMFNAPENAQYNVYKDNNQNYIFDDEDTLLGTLNCNHDGVGYFNNLSKGYYVAVLQTEYKNITTDKEYSFFSDGKSITSQEAFKSNGMSFNRVYSSENDTINLDYDVPLYKQTDARWRYSKINGSSDTMGNVGCLITSFAMLRSYETGKEILPSQMMKSYSSSTGIGVVFSGGASMSVPKSSANYGWNVYGYTSAYGGNGEIPNNTKTNQALLKYLYQRLQKSPVIYGGYSTYNGRGGSNHWIVIKGYKGDGVNFSASDFYVCDPGANRTTLADYISKYPYWDRIIYNPTANNTQIVTTTTTTATTTEYIVTTTLIPNLITLPKQTTTVTSMTESITTENMVTTTLISDLITLPNNTDLVTSVPEFIEDTTQSETVTTTVPIVSDNDISNETILLGDVNGDGDVNQLDVFILKKYILQTDLDNITFNTSNADIDGNQKVTANDLNLMLNLILNG